MTKLLAKTVVFLDTETTGLDANKGEVIEFAAIRRVGPGDEDRTVFRVRMERPEAAEAKALEINGYTPEGWVNAISQKEAAETMAALLTRDTIVVGHNVPFDMEFIAATVRRELGEEAARKLPYHKVDTVTLAYEQLAPCGLEKLSLVNVCEFLGLSNHGAHSAMADAERCMKVYDKLARAGWLKRLWWKFRPR